MEIDHLGYLVRNIEKAIVQFEAMGFECITNIITDDMVCDGQNKARNVKLCFLKNSCVRMGGDS